MTTYGHFQEIAADLITQLAAQTFGITYTAEYKDIYVSYLEDLPAAGTATATMRLVIGPIEQERERTGWGAQRITCTLGLLFQVMVSDASDLTEIGPYRKFIDDVMDFLIGPRYFASAWCAGSPKAVFGDDFADELFEQSKFQAIVLAPFFADKGVN